MTESNEVVNNVDGVTREVTKDLSVDRESDLAIIRRITDTQVQISVNVFARGFLQIELKHAQDRAQLILKGVYLDAFVTLLREFGFYKLYGEDSNEYQLIHVKNNIIEETTIDRAKSRVYACLLEITDDLTIDYNGATNTFPRAAILNIFSRNYTQIFNAAFFEFLPEFTKPILRDTDDVSFIPF